MDNKKLNLGLMDDINKQNSEFSDWNNLMNESQNDQGLTQSRLDHFMDFKATTSNKPIKQKKLYQNLNDFSFQKELRIKVFGIGGAGNNMVKYMAYNSNIEKESLFAINTDYQVLKTMPEDINLILIGNKTTNGYGSGSNPEIGKEAAIESEEIIRSLLEDTDLLFIVSGMGKGTGTGASPVIAKIAREMGILTLASVNLPSISNEGKIIYERGQVGLEKLKETVAGIMTISNEKLFNETDESISLEQAFIYANSVISNVINEIINLVNVPAQVNVDFNDVKTFFKEPTVFQVNTFNFKTHDNIETQIQEQLKNLIYQDSIEGARKAIVNFKLNPNISRDIVNNITKALMTITRNNQLEITIAIDYFENIECARVSTLLAMDSTDEFNINDYSNYDVNEHDRQQKTTIELEIFNTTNEQSESKPTTIELTTNQLLTEQQENSKRNSSTHFKELNKSFKNVLSEFVEIKQQISESNQLNTNNADFSRSDLEASRQEVRRNFMPTKKLNQDDKLKTIQFYHHTGPKKII